MRFQERFEHSVTLLSGMAIGAGLMYVFDPDRGTRRRSEARQRLVRMAHLLGRETRKHSRDLLNRLVGSLAEARSTIRESSRIIPDDRLVDRVRAQLGHVVFHPGLLDITASGGRVTVSGPILETEIEKITDRLNKIRGVLDYELRVEPRSASELQKISGRKGRVSQKEAI